jgi:hypothetical protein
MPIINNIKYVEKNLKEERPTGENKYNTLEFHRNDGKDSEFFLFNV